MWSAETEAHWRQLAEEAFTGMKDWRVRHPTATLCEIEAALDERLARVRARMLQDTALASAAADLRALPVAERPRCPECGEPMEARGQEARHLTTSHEQPLTLRRHYAACPACGAGLFPPR